MPSKASTSRSSRPAPTSRSELAPAAVAHGATVIDNSSAWRMDPTIPLVVSQVNPDDLEGHPGIIANPNCSTMQLAPVLMALRDTVGLERVVVDTYQSVSGHRRRRPGRARGPDPRPRRRRGTGRERLPAPDRVQRAARDRRLPRPTATPRRNGRSSPRTARSSACPDLRISCTAVRIPVFVSHSEAVHVETRDPITPERARELFAAVPGRHRPGRPGRASTTRWRPRPPAATRSSSGASGATSRSPTTAASRSGSSRTTCARAPRRTPSRSPRSCASADWITPGGHPRRPAVPGRTAPTEATA